MITLVRCEAAKFSDFMAKKKQKKKIKPDILSHVIYAQGV